MDSTWQNVDIMSTYLNVLLIHGGLFPSKSYIVILPGNKRLTMRTTGVYIGATGLYGSLCVSQNEYNRAN